jgi:hypothetical protein
MNMAWEMKLCPTRQTKNSIRKEIFKNVLIITEHDSLTNQGWQTTTLEPDQARESTLSGSIKYCEEFAYIINSYQNFLQL